MHGLTDPGIISALAFSPDAQSGVFAAGSLSPPPASSSNIAIFSEATGEAPIMFIGSERNSHGPSPVIRASVMQVMMFSQNTKATETQHSPLYS